MFRFRSVISRIAFLHIIAVVVTCLAMPAALYFMLDHAVTQLHEHALRGQAREIAESLSRDPNGKWRLNLSPRLGELYSEAYGRYQYDIRDADGRLLFSSHKKAGGVEKESISGADVIQTIGDARAWDRQHSSAFAPLGAVTAALWGLRNAPDYDVLDSVF